MAITRTGHHGPRTIIAAALLLGSLALPSTARAFPGGSVVITDHEIDTSSPSFEKDLKKSQKAAIVKQGASWKIYFIAYLKKAAGATELNIVFRDVTGGKKDESPNAYPVGTQPSAKIIKSDVELTEEQNFKAGHKYDVRITRLVNGKEDVYASTHVELK